jgi:undecaprenyl-diphosphatase
MSSFCFYGVLAGLYSARIRSRSARLVIWVVSGVLIAGIGLSRIYLGVHYPTDVIAGYLAGAVWVSTLLLVDRLGPRTRKAP